MSKFEPSQLISRADIDKEYDKLHSALMEISNDTDCLGYPNYERIPSNAAKIAKKVLGITK
jgi:hypothetical protein